MKSITPMRILNLNKTSKKMNMNIFNQNNKDFFISYLNQTNNYKKNKKNNYNKKTYKA